MGILREPVWEDPPDEKKRGGHRKRLWANILRQLLARPNTWARVADYDDGATARSALWILRCNGPVAPYGHYEYRAKDKSVYARYVSSIKRSDS